MATTARVFTDGGIETDLIFLRGLDLPAFAAFPLLDDEAGRAALADYYTSFLRLAADERHTFVLATPTWRANPDWGRQVGYDAAALDRVNADAVRWLRELAAEVAPEVEVVLDGVLGPRADGYVVGERMSTEEARAYHAPQIRALVAGGVDTISAMTITYPEEAVGIALAARDAGVPVLISFTTETDGLLPDGTTLAAAVETVETATEAYPVGYLVNCSHPDHFTQALVGDWTSRLVGIRANASRQSHAELDAAEELDAGDPIELASAYRSLADRFPSLSIFGGCCGTDVRHLQAIAAALR